LQQGSKSHRQREAAARKSEGGSGGADGPRTKTEGHSKNLDRTAGSSDKGEFVKDDTANENVVRPQEQRPEDTTSRRPTDNKDTDKAKVNVNVSSREFVRGGRGRLRGSARGRGRGGHQDVYRFTSHREVGFANQRGSDQRGSADDASNTRVASAPSNTARTNGSEQKRTGSGKTDAQQSKMEDRKSSHERLVGHQQVPTKVDAEYRQNARDSVQSPSDDPRRKDRGSLQSSVANTPPAKGTSSTRTEIPAQASRRRTEFYDSRIRGQKMSRSDVKVDTPNKPREQPHTAPAKDEADAEKNDKSRNKGSNEEANEQTSQRKSGENYSFTTVVWNTFSPFGDVSLFF